MMETPTPIKIRMLSDSQRYKFLKKDLVVIIPEQYAQELIKEGLAEYETILSENFIFGLNSFENKKKFIGSKDAFEDIFENAKTLVDDGILYDSDGALWRWNYNLSCYEFCDKTDLLNIVAEKVSIFSALNPMYKTAFEQSLKMHGRERAKLICVNSDIKYKYSVQFRNIIYNGISLIKEEVTPEFFVFNPIPHSPIFFPTNKIDELFNQWTNGKVNLLKDILAYSCIPNNAQKLIFFYLGPRNSGKSQFMGVLKRFLGSHNCVTTNLGILADQTQRFEIINLRNKLCALVSEVDEKTTYNTAILKRLSGNDDLRGEYKGITGIPTFRFGGKVHIITNSLPTVADETDYAYFARTVIIEFPNTFANTDIEAVDTIPNEEYEGLAHYCLERIQTWYKNKKIEIEGLEPVDLRAKKYLQHTDFLGSFVSSHMEMELDFEPDTLYKINSGTFSSMFNEYLLRNGQKEWDFKRIGRVLMDKFKGKVERHKRRYDSDLIWEYRGIRVKSEQKVLNMLPSMVNVPDVPDVPDTSTSFHIYEKLSETNGNNGNNRNRNYSDTNSESSRQINKLVSAGILYEPERGVYREVK